MRQNDDGLKTDNTQHHPGSGSNTTLAGKRSPKAGQARPAHPRRPNIGTDGSQVRALGIPI